jgi:predicted Zn-dependent protease
LGASFVFLERWPEAEAAFRRGLILQPNHSSMRSNLCVAVARLGRFEEAVELLDQLLRDDPDNAPAQSLLAQLRERARLA